MTGNKKTGAVISFEADENLGMNAYTFADRVKKRVSDLGVGNYTRPVVEKDHESILPGMAAGQYFDGRLPTVIRRLSLDQLSSLYSLYSNWYGYLTTQTMLVATERSEAIRQKAFMLNHLKNVYRRTPSEDGKKIPETAIADAAKTDERYITPDAKYEELNALYNILESMRSVADQDMKVISREVTIQQEKIRKELLGQGFGNRGRDLNNFTEGDYGNQSSTPNLIQPQDDDSSDEEASGSRTRQPRRINGGAAKPAIIRPGTSGHPQNRPGLRR